MVPEKNGRNKNWCILLEKLVRTYSRRQAAAKAHNLELDSRLNGYFATLRTSSFGDVLRRSVDNWQIYAAAAGSAVAMTTNASASIIYSGILNQKAAVTGAPQSISTAVRLKSGAGATIHRYFEALAIQSVLGSRKYATVGIKGSEVDFLKQSGFVKRLSSGAKISGGTHPVHSSFFKGDEVVASQSIRSGHLHNFGWSRTEGFAGFSFTTDTNHQKDFGWVRLQFTVGSNSLIDSLTVIDWGYQNNGSAIDAGQEVTAPEPPTADLALLALGAAGVTALRRRRRQASV
jgi:MYXO-CTERM domain-containing protein